MAGPPRTAAGTAAGTVVNDIVIVGGGVAGLAVAIRSAAAGHRVQLFERNDELGGKLAVVSEQGHTFDIGPSLLTLPDLFDELLGLAGTSLADEVDLVRLDPQFQYRWPDGSSLEIPDDPGTAAACVEQFSPGQGEAFARFLDHGRRIWEVSERTFFAGPMQHPLALLRRMRSPRDLFTIDPLRTLQQRAAATFSDPRLVQWAGRYATYSGSSPYRVPATLACIPWIEAGYGCWYPMGGLGALRDALVRAARSVGVALHTGAEVTSIRTVAGRVSGVEVAGHGTVAADVVIANADAEHLYRDLLIDRRALRRVRRVKRSTSGFVICAAVTGRTAGLAHHNVWFSSDYRREFDDLDAGRFPADPTVYACVSSVTDPGQAPDGEENWFLLVNTPPGCQIDATTATTAVFAALEARQPGLDLADRARIITTLAPADLQRRYRAPGGAIYGTSSDGRRAAFARPGNISPVAGLYLVGGSSHPGGGLPLVTISARIVADALADALAEVSR